MIRTFLITYLSQNSESTKPQTFLSHSLIKKSESTWRLLTKKFDLKKKFKVPEKLLKFEGRMKEKKGQYPKQLHGIGDDM